MLVTFQRSHDRFLWLYQEPVVKKTSLEALRLKVILIILQWIWSCKKFPIGLIIFQKKLGGDNRTDRGRGDEEHTKGKNLSPLALWKIPSAMFPWYVIEMNSPLKQEQGRDNIGVFLSCRGFQITSDKEEQLFVLRARYDETTFCFWISDSLCQNIYLIEVFKTFQKAAFCV